jgi:hypothetical protein
MTDHSTRPRYLLMLALFWCLFAPPTRLQADSWTTYGHDPQNTARSSSQFDPRLLQFSWASPVLPVGYLASVIAGSSVYATQDAQSGPYVEQVASFDLPTGNINWTYASGIGRTLSSLAESDGLIAFTSGYPNTNLTPLNEQTGALAYNVLNVPGTFDANGPSPVLAHSPGNQLVAYTAGPYGAAAVALGPNSGQQLWVEGGSLGGGAAPTLVGSSVVAAGPGQYYAYNQADGGTNHFVASTLSGGGADTTVYDATRQQFYVPDDGWITAFKYVNNDTITQLWSVNGLLGLSGRLALGPDGKIYAFTRTSINELDPNSGTVLRSVAGTFGDNVPPLIQGSYLWIGGLQVTAYDLTTLSPVATINPGIGEFYNYFPAAVDDSHFIINYVDGVGPDRGFVVYSVPEPGAEVVFLIALGLTLRRRRSRFRPHDRERRIDI